MSFRLVSSDELLARAKEEVEWLVHPLMVRGSSMMIYARQGAGKSSAAIQLAHSLVTGEPWLGFEIMNTGPVIYLQIDMPMYETMGLLERAAHAKLYTGPGLLLPESDDPDIGLSFNILSDEDYGVLEDLCAQVKPIAVIVDTIHDAFEPDGDSDINALQRRVHKRLRAAINGAALVFLNHQRKQSALAKARGEEDDEDSFMGGQTWEGVVASSLFLKRTGRSSAKLRLAKVRLAERPFEWMELEIDENGFFVPKRDYKQMMLVWPDCLPETERLAELAKLKTKADVLKRIAEVTGESYETIRKHEQRHPHSEYRWKKYLPSE